ncbi:MAG: hypothetical protein ABSB35_17225 [Bryobacteraceae bacterium]|jgi:hypothetical protein
MYKLSISVFAALAAVSTAGYGQTAQLGAALNFTDVYQVGYAANLNIGDAVINISNVGAQSGFWVSGVVGGGGSLGNICSNVYTFDSQEEEVSCCACLVTPNGLDALSVKNDLISNTLTPAVPTSVIIKLVASVPATNSSGYSVCNPSTIDLTPGHFTQVGVPNNAGAGTGPGWLTNGMIAWGTTLEPDSPTGTYGVVNVPYQKEPLSTSELTALTTICNFIQTNGTGYGICKSCQTGALSGAKN